MSTETTTLYRPVGIYELKLIQESGYTAFPPRHPEQPIFYPVLNPSYAEEIASKWNPTDENSGYMGAVTRFIVPTAYLAQYEEQVVGNASQSMFEALSSMSRSSIPAVVCDTWAASKPFAPGYVKKKKKKPVMSTKSIRSDAERRSLLSISGLHSMVISRRVISETRSMLTMTVARIQPGCDRDRYDLSISSRTFVSHVVPRLLKVCATILGMSLELYRD